MKSWQRTKDALPKDGGKVLIYENGSIWIAFWVRPRYRFYDGEGGTFPKATHWMPLPEPPEEGK